jgi:hypothetical protein
MRKFSGCLLLLLLALFIISGCEGPRGPAGPTGPSGNNDTSNVYLGDNATNCKHCHDAKIVGWATTTHSESYKETQACNECHSTGWNTQVNNGGYDDNPTEALRNVQCEACHGPMGPNPALHQPSLQANLSGEACSQCHATEYAEWRGAAHADSASTPAGLIAEWGSSSCYACHLTEGYLYTWDAANHTAPTFADGNAHAVTCGACHDAHNLHTEKNLRAQSTINLPNPAGATITGWGMGLTCGNCHRDRRSASQINDQITGGNAHFGPHGSPQANMLAGVGSYKIPSYTYTDTLSQHMISDLPDKCVDCHMAKTGEGPHYTTRGHTFEPSLAKCQECHEEATDFDIGGVQTEVHALMDSLEFLVLQNSALQGTMDSVGVASLSTQAERQASWAWFFVTNDKSFGVHNMNYTMTILNNSIALLNASRAKAGPEFASIRAH